MIEFKNAIFDQSGFELRDSVRLDPVGEICEHGAIKITAFGIEEIIDSFSFVTCRSTGDSISLKGNALLLYLNHENKSGIWVLLFGTLKVVLIDVSCKTIHTPVLLYRSKDDDQGFYTNEVFEYEGRVLVTYESGILMINKSKIEWHKEKKWNTFTKSIESNCLSMILEKDDGSEVIQKIDIQTGETISVEPLKY